MNYTNKTIWITGASGGIGQALVKSFDEQGASLILSGRNQAVLEKIKAHCRKPNKHQVVCFDLSDAKAVLQAAEQVCSEFQIDVLVNNGGISQRSLALETQLEVDRRVMEIDYFAAVALTKQVAAQMVARQTGLIINISSVAGKVGSPLRSAYSGAKHALIGFMDCLRAELASYNVRVVNVCPGFVHTNISRNALTGDASPYAKLDDEINHGMATDTFAKLLMKRLNGGNDEIIIATGLPRLGSIFRRLMPNTFIKILPKIYKRKH
ncbi:SDR family NAD(P)-dependent oxidoreductase [Aliikangiella sp. IMCC44632]